MATVTTGPENFAENILKSGNKVATVTKSDDQKVEEKWLQRGNHTKKSGDKVEGKLKVATLSRIW